MGKFLLTGCRGECKIVIIRILYKEQVYE
jgi:hypothetical protein